MAGQQCLEPLDGLNRSSMTMRSDVDDRDLVLNATEGVLTSINSIQLVPLGFTGLHEDELVVSVATVQPA